jgi:hypothetical protein
MAVLSQQTEYGNVIGANITAPVTIPPPQIAFGAGPFYVGSDFVVNVLNSNPAGSGVAVFEASTSSTFGTVASSVTGIGKGVFSNLPAGQYWFRARWQDVAISGGK